MSTFIVSLNETGGEDLRTAVRAPTDLSGAEHTESNKHSEFLGFTEPVKARSILLYWSSTTRQVVSFHGRHGSHRANSLFAKDQRHP